jgi:WD40 repeat protein
MLLPRIRGWIKKKFTTNEEATLTNDEFSSSDGGEEYYDVDEDLSWDTNEQDMTSNSLNYEDDEWGDVEGHLEVPSDLEDQARVREAFASPVTRSRSSSSSTSNSTNFTPSTHAHPTCGSCQSCIVGKYKTNPFTDINILNGESSGHHDIIRQILPLGDDDENRDAFYRRQTPFLIASAGDDGAIIIWDIHTGRKEFVLHGHRLRVTCMIKIPHRRLLVSGGCDKMIKIWSIDNGDCISTLSRHTSSVRCLLLLDENKFCSGGNDPELCVWDLDGTLLGTIERGEDENLNAMIAIDSHRICTASEKELLHVYDTEKFCTVATLEGHKNTVLCLTKVNDFLFASASVDGVIIIWDILTLMPKQVLNDTVQSPVTPTKKPVKKSPNSPNAKTLLTRKVFNMTVINDKYLGVAIGKGFKVYEIETGDLLLYQDEAHYANVNKLIPLHRGSVIVTCSDDSEIKIWNAHRQLRKKKGAISQTPSSMVSGMTPYSSGKKTPRKKELFVATTVEPHVNETMQATLIGEMALHTKAVQDIVPLSYHSFASCGADVSILIWKDSRMERRLRSFYALQHIHIANQKSVKLIKSDSQSNVRRVLLGEYEVEETT